MAGPSKSEADRPGAEVTANETGASLLKDAQDISDRLVAAWSWPAPADHDRLADIGGREPDL